MSLKIGISFPLFPKGVPPTKLLAARACQVESLGFDSLWIGERVLTQSGMPDPFAILGYFAALTKRITLGTGVVLLPLRQPLLVAKAASTLDVLSGGRFILGVAPGGDFPVEFEACGVLHQQRGGRTREAVALLRRLWREPSVDHDGLYYQIHGGPVEPEPYQTGGPPIWIGGRGDWAVRCAGQLGDSWFPSFMPPARYRESWRRVCDLASACGRDPSLLTGAINVIFNVGPSFESAWPIAADVLGNTYHRTYSAEFMKKHAVVGSVEDCREMVGRLAEAGCRHFVLMPMCPVEALEEQFAAVAEALLPLRGGDGQGGLGLLPDRVMS